MLEQYFPWPKPQYTGNREELRCCSFTEGAGDGLMLVAIGRYAASASPWSELKKTLAPHTHQMPSRTDTYLYLLADVTEPGDYRCGPILSALRR